MFSKVPQMKLSNLKIPFLSLMHRPLRVWWYCYCCYGPCHQCTISVWDVFCSIVYGSKSLYQLQCTHDRLLPELYPVCSMKGIRSTEGHGCQLCVTRGIRSRGNEQASGRVCSKLQWGPLGSGVSEWVRELVRGVCVTGTATLLPLHFPDLSSDTTASHLTPTTPPLSSLLEFPLARIQGDRIQEVY